VRTSPSWSGARLEAKAIAVAAGAVDKDDPTPRERCFDAVVHVK
jgi:hypothetical protein